MKANIITLLRGNGAVPEFRASRAANPKQDHRFDRHRDAQALRVPRRRALVMIWRVHAASGRLQCRWALEGSAAADEDVGCGNFLPRAA
jgi:hypothetical protein